MTAHEEIKEQLFLVPSDNGEGHGWYQGKGWMQKWNPGMRTQAVGTQGDHERKRVEVHWWRMGGSAILGVK